MIKPPTSCFQPPALPPSGVARLILYLVSVPERIAEWIIALKAAEAQACTVPQRLLQISFRPDYAIS